jgi:hypothetical protein
MLVIPTIVITAGGEALRMALESMSRFLEKFS